MRYTSLQAIKTWSDMMAGKDDKLIEDLIERVCPMVDQHCQQVFGQRTVASLPCVGAVDPHGRLRVWVPAPAVASVSSLVFRHPTSRGLTTVAAGDLFWDDAPSGAVIQTEASAWGLYRSGRLGVQLSGTIGWAANAIPLDFELQIRKLVFWAYKRRETAAEKTAIPDLGVVIIPQAWPPDIKEGLRPYIRVTGY